MAKKKKFVFSSAAGDAPFPGAVWDREAGWLKGMTRCDSESLYQVNPFDLPRSKKEITDEGKAWIREKLYTMPYLHPNPGCWVQRCDLIYADFKRACISPQHEGDFWAEVRVWLPGLKAFAKETTQRLVREEEEGGKFYKYLRYWTLETYYVLGLGYNDNPPRPW